MSSKVYSEVQLEGSLLSHRFLQCSSLGAPLEGRRPIFDLHLDLSTCEWKAVLLPHPPYCDDSRNHLREFGRHVGSLTVLGFSHSLENWLRHFPNATEVRILRCDDSECRDCVLYRRDILRSCKELLPWRQNLERLEIRSDRSRTLDFVSLGDVCPPSCKELVSYGILFRFLGERALLNLTSLTLEVFGQEETEGISNALPNLEKLHLVLHLSRSITIEVPGQVRELSLTRTLPQEALPTLDLSKCASLAILRLCLGQRLNGASEFLEHLFDLDHHLTLLGLEELHFEVNDDGFGEEEVDMVMESIYQMQGLKTLCLPSLVGKLGFGEGLLRLRRLKTLTVSDWPGLNEYFQCLKLPHGIVKALTELDLEQLILRYQGDTSRFPLECLQGLSNEEWFRMARYSPQIHKSIDPPDETLLSPEDRSLRDRLYQNPRTKLPRDLEEEHGWQLVSCQGCNRRLKPKWSGYKSHIRLVHSLEGGMNFEGVFCSEQCLQDRWSDHEKKVKMWCLTGSLQAQDKKRKHE